MATHSSVLTWRTPGTGEPGGLPSVGSHRALLAALLSIVLKEGVFHYTIVKARELESQALEANAWHHRSDALSSIGTAIGIGGAIFLGSRWAVLDPDGRAHV